MTNETVVRTSFYRELERVQDEVLVLGSMVEKATLRGPWPSILRTLCSVPAATSERSRP